MERPDVLAESGDLGGAKLDLLEILVSLL